MTARQTHGTANRIHLGAGLALTLHFDAVRRSPQAWLAALWWRIVGKKVRSRARFAALFAASPHAYRVWLRSETRLEDAPDEGPAIVALVAEGPGQEDTLHSLARQGVQALVIGSAEIPKPSDAVARIDWSARPWLMPLAAGDVLAPGAAAAYRAAAGATTAAIVYADDDLLDVKGRRVDVHFKPSWNAELQSHFDYLTGACVLRASTADLAAVSGPDWAARLISTKTGVGRAVHIPHVLHHRRVRPTPRLPVTALPATTESAQAALPRVTVIIPTRNRVDLLSTCIAGLARTDYPDVEVIVVDNGSDDLESLEYLAGLDPTHYRVLRDDGPFNFSALNNRAARLASGELLCLLNNDIEMLGDDWLAIMVRQALRPEVGAVGARLLYPDGRIQHAGVVTGICGGACHAHRLLQPDEEGYFHRHSLPQFVSAVTAACLVVRRESFEAVGGLDESKFAVAFNDVDLCLKLNARGWQSLYEPRATLVHHESVSRGLDRDPVGAARLAGELAALRERWGIADMEARVDPYHHPQLSRYSERFVVRISQ
ncbi:glycosyltransferase family 2 protein [Novosphingobium sp. BL-8A]|uniref:glycosyltransferase family 2 protein n=1 Tax=Novosphingobium sp. BL-8A TaxID=3127639 RepID=UPI0037567838